MAAQPSIEGTNSQQQEDPCCGELSRNGHLTMRGYACWFHYNHDQVNLSKITKNWPWRSQNELDRKSQLKKLLQIFDGPGQAGADMNTQAAKLLSEMLTEVPEIPRS